MANVLTLTSPLMRRTVGFDRINDMIESLLSETAETADNYPPYNIEKLGDDEYRIIMAVAGFGMDDLDIVLQDGELTVSGDIQQKENTEDIQFLHRGIGTRSFKRAFRLADHIQVTEASMKDGLLTIHLFREIPEEKKPRTIPIKGAAKLLGKKKT